jgi:hypothetical protein
MSRSSPNPNPEHSRPRFDGSESNEKLTIHEPRRHFNEDDWLNLFEEIFGQDETFVRDVNCGCYRLRVSGMDRLDFPWISTEEVRLQFSATEARSLLIAIKRKYIYEDDGDEVDFEDDFEEYVEDD